jgi:oxygen-independent coproporphyrinogen III oxidase
LATVESHLPSNSLSAPSPAAVAEARAGLYVHVPFCATRCTYCDFSSGAISPQALERYVQALAIECARREPGARGTTFTSVFFGGGTPSALPPSHFDRVRALLSNHFAIAPDAEITLEANPESVHEARLEAWARGGVNRLSMGAQSVHADELERLGRPHAPERPSQALALARRFGFRRLSLDLMFAFPGHTLARFGETLERVIALDTEHVSAYCYIPESGTPMGDAVLDGREPVPDDDAQAALYELATARFTAAGLACYETSNFCRPGAEARHNLVYWLRRTYVGIGPSAHGFVGGRRYGNHYGFARWATALERGESPEAESTTPDDVEAAREALMLSLRLTSGLRASDHAPAAWRTLVDRYAGAWRDALATGRLERGDGALRIPHALRFLADDVIAWIDAEADRGRFDSGASGFLPSMP